MVDEVLAERLFLALKAQKKKVVFAESLTGGLISAEFTKRPGASEILWGSFVTYSVESKKKLLYVPQNTLDMYGVVSIETAEAMALGALRSAFCENCFPYYSAAVTGIAGPSVTDLSGKNIPSGTVCISAAKLGKVRCGGEILNFAYDIEKKSALFRFKGDRESVRFQTVNEAFNMILSILDR